MDKAFLTKFGSTVRKKRFEKNLTMEKLAFAADLTSDYLGRIELGKANPSIFVVNKIAKALGIKLSELVKDL